MSMFSIQIPFPPKRFLSTVFKWMGQIKPFVFLGKLVKMIHRGKVIRIVETFNTQNQLFLTEIGFFQTMDF
jgi:hypothetical protein